jgi:hypothetical protein
MATLACITKHNGNRKQGSHIMRVVQALCRNQRRSSFEVVRVCNHYLIAIARYICSNTMTHSKFVSFNFSATKSYEYAITRGCDVHECSSPTAITARVHTQAVNRNCDTQFTLSVTYDAEQRNKRSMRCCWVLVGDVRSTIATQARCVHQRAICLLKKLIFSANKQLIVSK